jgi:drug/metabolite transporter (DMT)-like permease
MNINEKDKDKEKKIEQEKNNNNYYTFLYILLFFISQLLSVYGAFISLPHKNLSLWEAYKMVIPYAWIGWIFLMSALYLVNKHKGINIVKIGFLLILIQFTVVLIINKIVLKENPKKSDIIAFIIIFIGNLISENHYISKIFNIPISEYNNVNKEQKKEIIEQSEDIEAIDIN